MAAAQYNTQKKALKLKQNFKVTKQREYLSSLRNRSINIEFLEDFASKDRLLPASLSWFLKNSCFLTITVKEQSS